MGSVEDLLEPLGCYTSREDAWKRITSGSVLFEALSEAVRNRVPHNWAEQQALVEGYREDILQFDPRSALEKSRLLEPAPLVRDLIWCAQQAVYQPELGWDDIGSILGTWRATRTGAGLKDIASIWGCIRSLHNPVYQARTVAMPVALTNEEWSGGADSGRAESAHDGFIATLVLEVLDRGADQVYQHPIDALLPDFHQDLVDSMSDAWKSARTLDRSQGVEIPRCDGRWRLLQGHLQSGHSVSELQPVRLSVGGRSMSGAAALGWWLALRGKVPDDEMIVLAQVRVLEGGSAKGVPLLDEVDGIPAKVKAVDADGNFDTIVVAGERNQREALETLSGLGWSSGIKVASSDDPSARRNPSQKLPSVTQFHAPSGPRRIKLVNLNGGLA